MIWLCVVAYVLLAVISAGVFKGLDYSDYWFGGVIFPLAWCIVAIMGIVDFVEHYRRYHHHRVVRFVSKFTSLSWMTFPVRFVFRLGESIGYRMDGQSPPPEKQAEGAFRIGPQAPTLGDDFCLHATVYATEEDKIQQQVQAEIHECLTHDPYKELT